MGYSITVNMKLTTIAPDLGGGLWEDDSVRVLVMYEEFRASIRALEMVERLERRMGEEFQPEIKVWKFDVLELSPVRVVAAKAAADADVIIIAGRETMVEGFSESMEAWFDLWTGRRRARATLMVALLEAEEPGANEPGPRARRLRQIAEMGEMDLYTYLKPWEERELEAGGTAKSPFQRTSTLKDAQGGRFHARCAGN